MAFSVAGRRVVVVGAARSGRAAAELLRARGARVTLSDELDAVEEAAALLDRGIQLELGGNRPETLAAADLVVLSPGVPADRAAVQTARQAGVPVIAEIELASRWIEGRIVAITGTKGKSTTTALTGRVLAGSGRPVLVGGNIGTALSAQVPMSTPDTLHVVEVSSFQLEGTTSFHPWIAVFLNFSPDHLDRHPTVEAYGEAKRRIFANQTGDDWAVINADDPMALHLAREGRARRLPFALDTPLDRGVVVADGTITRRDERGDTPLVPVSAVRLPGRHLLADVLAAAAVGAIAGVRPESIAAAVSSFEGLEHALEPAGVVKGVRFVNDSKATNIEAARRSVEAFEGPLVVIAGGRFKGGDLGLFAEPLVARARGVVTIGESQALFREALGDRVVLVEADSMPDAVRRAYRLARPGDTVLLAPACASFDMFRDYAERGRVFKTEVARLGSELDEIRSGPDPGPTAEPGGPQRQPSGG